MDPPSTLSWSGTYAVLPRTSGTYKDLPGDKMILPQSALEQLLAAAASRASSGTAATSLDLDPYSSRHENATQLPQPMTFRLTNPANRRVVYAGIREFSAPEDAVGLGRFLSDALGVDLHQDDDGHEAASPAQIAVRAQELPKGTRVRLRPLEAGYNPDDWKSLLERHLRENFTCLSKNSVLSVPGIRGETFNFLVDDLSPEGEAICVVDTDLEVDIEPLNEEQARETLRQIISKAQSASANGTSDGGELDVWKPVEGEVSSGGYVDYLVPSWDRSQPLTISLSDMSRPEGLDMFVTPRSSRHRALPRDSTHVFGNFGPPDHGLKSITIAPTNAELDGADGLRVSVHAARSDDAAGPLSGPISYKLRAQAAPASAPVNDTGRAAGEAHSADEEQCPNCLQWVPSRTMVLHESFCRRNNVICAQCKVVFKKGSADWDAHWHCERDGAHGNSASSRIRHDDVFHKERCCPSCEFATNSLPDLARHRTTICPGKLILCRFCHLEVPQEGDPLDPAPEVAFSGMTAHELADGARTTECHLCDKIVRMRDMETHLKHHELDKVNRSKPAICRNVNCGRTLHGVGPRGQVGAGGAQKQWPDNELRLCSQCFGPLYVSMHDPEGKALRRRIERRYLGQMMTGCGKSHCANEWCKTGRAKAGLEPKGSSAQAVLPMVKPLLALVDAADEPMYFCVDEASQQWRKVASMMAAERGWELEWCIAAAEATRGQPDKMRDWLNSWAPRR